MPSDATPARAPSEMPRWGQLATSAQRARRFPKTLTQMKSSGRSRPPGAMPSLAMIAPPSRPCSSMTACSALMQPIRLKPDEAG
jgi:hypothetical protein